MSTAQPAKQFPLPLDRVALVVIGVLSLLIGALLWNGDHTAPKVRDFNWQDRQVGAADQAFILTFSRPMDHASVESNLQIDPPLPGKISWAGRRMAYTLTMPIPYGTAYKVQLKGATDRFTEQQNRVAIQPFVGSFTARDRAFAYIGIEGEEEGQLILYNLTSQRKTILTPKDLVVMDFQFYPNGDRILFSAADRQSQRQGLPNNKLYRVTTGISINPPDNNLSGTTNGNSSRSTVEAVGKLELVLGNQDYQNLKFDLAPDGNSIVVQRVNQKNPADTRLWVIKANEEPKPLDNQPGGDFLITPDSQTVAVAQGQGLAILPLTPATNTKTDPLDFLPKFGTVLSFARDGAAAAMIKFNTDYTRSLFLVTNQGVQEEVLRTTGSILSAQFDPLKQTLYCLLTRLIPGPEYQEQPFLAAIDLKPVVSGDQKTYPLRPLLLLPNNQRDLQLTLSPDGLALLFDQTVTAPIKSDADADAPRSSDGQAIASSRLWLLPIAADPTAQSQFQPESLPLTGFHPRWLP